jgi:predicted nucleic acid-binding protein
MAGQLFDLGLRSTRLPDRIVVDTNIITARLLSSFYPVYAHDVDRVNDFFSLLQSAAIPGVLPTVVYQEFLHLALRGHYQRVLPAYRPALMSARGAKRRHSWTDLYKLRPELVSQFLPDLERLLVLLDINGLVALQPASLLPLTPEQRYEEELVECMGRFQLDTSDAALLLEAQRAGIPSIATLDADFRRAQSDFDIYTWP